MLYFGSFKPEVYLPLEKMCLFTKCFRSSNWCCQTYQILCEEPDAFNNKAICFFMALQSTVHSGWSLVSSIRAQSCYGMYNGILYLLKLVKMQAQDNFYMDIYGQ